MTRFKINNLKFINPSVYRAFYHKRITNRAPKSILLSQTGYTTPVWTKVGYVLPYHPTDKKLHKQLTQLESLFNKPIFTQDFL